jgi:hypothetical protein
MADPPPRQTTRPARAHELGRGFHLLLLGLARDVREYRHLGARPLQRGDDGLGHAQLDKPPVGNDNDRPIVIVDGRRIGADGAPPARPERDLGNSSGSECAEVCGEPRRDAHA